jgi:hypothetical protein
MIFSWRHREIGEIRAFACQKICSDEVIIVISILLNKTILRTSYCKWHSLKSFS